MANKNRSTSLGTRAKRWTRKRLIALGVPAMLIPGLLIALALGWNPVSLGSVKDYHEIRQIFPSSGIAAQVIDGDTFELQNGVGVRLIGIDAPNRGEARWEEAREALSGFISEKRVYLEYDRYQDDKYGRVLAWV
ncbi:MAG: thermonuclease family protein [bacterium]|nr:thermonuclease family protein [bacterium]